VEDEISDGSGSISEATPDASGNVWNELQTKFATKELLRKGELHFVPTPKISSIHCSGQRGDYLIEDDTRRPKLIMNHEVTALNHIRERCSAPLVLSC